MVPGAEQPAGEADRRQFPRVDLTLTVTLSGPLGGTWTAASVNVSRRGLQVQCSREIALALVGECRRAEPVPGAGLVGIAMTLPGPGGDRRPVAARCRLVYARAASEDTSLLGLEYAAFAADSYDVLHSYILACLRY